MSITPPPVYKTCTCFPENNIRITTGIDFNFGIDGVSLIEERDPYYENSIERLEDEIEKLKKENEILTNVVMDYASCDDVGTAARKALKKVEEL
jgi:hypothetical protein